MMSFGQNLAELSPSMVKLLAHPDLVVKKIACHFLVEYSRGEKEHTLLAINTLMTDAKDSNPMTRALALKTLCSFHNEAFLDYCLKCLPQGLRDKSAHVRRVAVICCQRLHAVSPAAVLEAGLVDELYGMIRDIDPIVVVNSLSVLEELLRTEGGVVVNQSMAHHLLNALPKLTEWGLETVFSVLTRYTPKSEEEMFDIMNVIDSYLRHSNLAVSTSCLRFFLCIVAEHADLRQEVFVRARDSVLSSLTSGSPELTYTVLELVAAFMPECVATFTDHTHAFLCRHNEAPYLKVKRLQLLGNLVTESNVTEVVEELGVSCTDIVKEVSAAAVANLAIVARTSSSSMQACVRKLQDLVELSLGHTLSNVVQVVEQLAVDSAEELAPIVQSLCGKYCLITEPLGRAAFLHLLGQYRQEIPEGAYILEDLIDNWLEEADTHLKRSFLTAGLRLFSWSPAACQESLGQILEVCAVDEDQDLSDSAHFYYKLLECDIHKALCILEGT